jgi:CheY-like chemotaxis protein
VSTGALLVVDDDEDIRRVARLALERIGGWRVTEAGSAADALAAVEAARFDAVLLDVMMPDVDGPALLERLRPRLGPDVPVVFLTAKAQAADVEALTARGAAGVLAKPFDPLRLPDELAGVLR